MQFLGEEVVLIKFVNVIECIKSTDSETSATVTIGE